MAIHNFAFPTSQNSLESKQIPPKGIGIGWDKGKRTLPLMFKVGAIYIH